MKGADVHGLMRVAVSLVGVLVLLMPAVAVGAPEGQVGVIVVSEESVQDPVATAREHGRRFGVQVDHVYQYAIQGYAATVNEKAAAGIARSPQVAWVEEEREFSTALHEGPQLIPTGITRIEADRVTRPESTESIRDST